MHWIDEKHVYENEKIRKIIFCWAQNSFVISWSENAIEKKWKEEKN